MLTVPAFAKVNLNLRIIGKRPDGFHEICTVFQTISLCDFLTFEESAEFSLVSNSPQMPTDASNIVVRSALFLREQFGGDRGAKIFLDKRIPSPGGLGGGSANAAITLLALNKLWKIGASADQLHDIAVILGADVPFFLHGGTMFGTGLGTDLTEMPDILPQKMLIVTPNVSVPTAQAYKSLNAPPLTEATRLGILQICRAEIGSLLDNLRNDFEATIFRLEPEIERVKNELLKHGAEAALMSGSGASVFGIFDNEAKRQKASETLRTDEISWQVFECESISRADYRRALEVIDI